MMMMMENTALGHTIKVHPIMWMDWHADEGSHGRDISVNDTEVSNLSYQYWRLNRKMGQVVFDGDVRTCSWL